MTGGGPHCKLVISQLEEELLELMGPVAVEGLTVLDPLLAVSVTFSTSNCLVE